MLLHYFFQSSQELDALTDHNLTELLESFCSILPELEILPDTI